MADDGPIEIDNQTLGGLKKHRIGILATCHVCGGRHGRTIALDLQKLVERYGPGYSVVAVRRAVVCGRDRRHRVTTELDWRAYSPKWDGSNAYLPARRAGGDQGSESA